MNTNIKETCGKSKLPAGLFSGLEIFFVNDKCYALRNGVTLEFNTLPEDEKTMFHDEYIEDVKGQLFLRNNFGITGFEAGFRQWLFCKYGALDGKPDLINNKLSTDSYNSACKRLNCPGRGKFCGEVSTLKQHEVETLRHLAAGKSAKEIAETLNVSVAAIKSRLEVLKERFCVPNAVALVAVVTEFGI